MVDKKYKLLEDDFVELDDGTRLYRIMALRDILTKNLTVIAGQKGGHIESERNLSHKGNCWVCDGCVVRENAFVCKDAIIKGGSEIQGEAYISGSAIVSSSCVDDNVIVTDKCVVNNCLLSGEKSLCGVRCYDGMVTIEAQSCDLTASNEGSAELEIAQI